MPAPLNLRPSRIVEIRAALRAGEPIREIAKRLRMGRAAIDRESLLMRCERAEQVSADRAEAGDVALPPWHPIAAAALPTLACLQVTT